MSALYNAQKLDEHMFSMCLVPDGGMFVLGGLEPRLHSSDAVQWTALSDDRSFYHVELNGVSVGDRLFSFMCVVANG